MAQTADNRQTDDKPNEPSREPERVRSRSVLTSERSTAAPAVMPPQNERNRTVIDGRRTDGTPCKLVVIQEISGTWALYPHGVSKFGVRLTKTNAHTLAQAILKGM
jgi:hypothetical protein